MMAASVDVFVHFEPSLSRPRIPARFNKPVIESQSWVHSASFMGDRAIKRTSQPGLISARFFRNTSRIRRFALFRATAPPTARLADTPNREMPFPFGAMTRIVNGWAYDFPVRRTRLKSVELVSRYLRSIYLIKLHPDPRNASPHNCQSSFPVYLLHMIVHTH